MKNAEHNENRFNEKYQMLLLNIAELDGLGLLSVRS